MNFSNVQFNADDFGITAAQSAHILDCARDGVINATSVLMNSPRLAACLPLLDDAALRVAVHLNLTEGESLAQGLLLLTDEKGRFRQSFFGLAWLSLTRRKKLRAEIKRELTAQVERARALMPGRPLRLDGHQHVQMLPLVMRCICELALERDWNLQYIRNAAEPIGPYLRHPALWGRYRPVNWIKNIVLHVCALFDRRFFKRLSLRSGCVFGLVLSGDMTWELVSVLLPDFIRWAERREKLLELVMHPGWGLAPEECLDPEKPGFVAFCTSEKRKEEADCVRTAMLRSVSG